MKQVSKKISALTLLTLFIGAVNGTSVMANDFCCYHGGQIWKESASARQARQMRQLERHEDQRDQGQPVIDASNPWRTTSKSKVRKWPQGYSYVGAPPMNFYNRFPGYGRNFYGSEPVPLGLHGPVDPYLLGWSTGWPMSPMPWGW